MPYHDDYRVQTPRKIHRNDKILLIEDSNAISTLLTQRLEEASGVSVVRCATLAAAHRELEQQRFTLALTGLNLPDAPKGEIVHLLSEYEVPTIIFTATFDKDARLRYAENKIIDYIVKDGLKNIDAVLATVNRILANGEFSVLVVDDVTSARSGLVQMLVRQNFQVTEAHSGTQALEFLSSDRDFDLVLTDYHMPDMDGYELTRRIRETRSSEELRIVGISSSSDRLLSASFLKAGASDFIYRPFVPEELQCRIDNNIETLRQLRHLRHVAERDYLTGLANRRHFFETMRSASLSSANGVNGANGAIAMLDIDHFKRVNDSYGHDMGDKVLVHIANLVHALCNDGRHLPARLGGEEFAIHLRNVDAFQAHSFCENLRQSIEQSPLSLGSRELSVTISVGVVEIEHGESIDNQLNAADQLLYMAKANGRNRVYSDLTIPEAMGFSVAVAE